MKDIISLRNHLFDALNRLADCHDAEELERETTKSAAIVQVAETIIKSAEVENNFIQITKCFGSGFIPVINDKKTLLELVKEQKEKPKELFNVDEQENWLNTEQGKVVNEPDSIGVHKLHTGNSTE